MRASKKTQRKLALSRSELSATRQRLDALEHVLADAILVVKRKQSGLEVVRLKNDPAICNMRDSDAPRDAPLPVGSPIGSPLFDHAPDETDRENQLRCAAEHWRRLFNEAEAELEEYRLRMDEFSRDVKNLARSVDTFQANGVTG